MSAPERPHFSSALTSVITLAGLAIGLGNLWRFPYMMGQHGGGAFLALYLVLMLVFAVPAMSAEWALGRATGHGPVGAFAAAFGRRAGRAVGALLLITLVVTASYYSLVVGNVAYSTWFAFSEGFSEETLSAYGEGLGRPGLQLLFAVLVITASVLVVSRGLKRGIEVANVVLVPAFAVAAFYLVYKVLQLPGATDRLLEFLQFDLSEITAEVTFSALGQTCFSIGLSGTLGIVYGSYLRRRQPIVRTAMLTAGLDVGAALLAALFVVPAVLIFGISLTSGPTLLFQTIPHLFSQLPGGRWLAGLFLSAWVSVALLTIVATLDTLVQGLGELQLFEGLKKHLTWLCALAMALIMTPIAFNTHWLGTLDLVFGSGMFILGSLLAIVALGWGLGKATTSSEINPGGGAPVLVFWIRWVIPPCVAAVLLGFVFSAL